MKIAALVPYHTSFCSGQRFRIELWARHLQGRGFEVELLPFASAVLTQILYQPGQHMRKAYRMLRCFADQLGRVTAASRPDLTYIYREAALIGPPLVERLTRRWGAPIVYDIDEPLFVPYVSPLNGRLNALRCIGKIDQLFRMSDHVFAVNRAIGDYAARHARRVSIVPMAVDTARYAPQPDGAPACRPRVGWVGTLTTQSNVELIAEPLGRLGRSCGATMRVIADRPMAVPGVDLEFITWESVDQEIALLRECTVGVVPVKANTWSPWKFFFKLVQMMSLGLPVVATPTGSNLEIIEDGVNGFLAATDEQWYDRLRTLLEDSELRRTMGAAARRTVEERFSLAHQLDFIEHAFRSTSRAA